MSAPHSYVTTGFSLSSQALGGKRGWLVKKEQLGVETRPDLAPAGLKVEQAADLLPRCPTTRRQRLRVCVKTPPAVAHEQSTGLRRGSTRRKGSRDFAGALFVSTELSLTYDVVVVAGFVSNTASMGPSGKTLLE